MTFIKLELEVGNLFRLKIYPAIKTFGERYVYTFNVMCDSTKLINYITANFGSVSIELNSIGLEDECFKIKNIDNYMYEVSFTQVRSDKIERLDKVRMDMEQKFVSIIQHKKKVELAKK